MRASASLLSVQEIGIEKRITTRDNVDIFLTHYPSKRATETRPLMLVHGASAWSNTFRVRTEIPERKTARRTSAVEFFQNAGYDVWLLDWRAGGRPEIVAQTTKLPRERFTMDRTAQYDIPDALKFVSHVSDNKTVDVIAHCMGAGSLAFGLGKSDLRCEMMDYLGKVILCTLGLFYESPWDGFAKVQDHLLDFVMGTDRSCRSISPAVSAARPWPHDLEFAFAKWPQSWKPQCGDPFCERLAFMFGSPYLESNLSVGIHDNLTTFFGPIPIAHYAHAAQNALRGYAAPFDVEKGKPPQWEACLDPSGFEKLKSIALVTGEQNILWHRESIDRMHEWLRRLLPGSRCQKRVFPGYGHQDLFWGKNAVNDIFPELLALLR